MELEASSGRVPVVNRTPGQTCRVLPPGITPRQIGTMGRHVAGPIEVLHEWLLILVPIAAVTWIPLVKRGTGNLTILDAILVLLWLTTILQLGGRASHDRLIYTARLICLLATIPELLGAIGAYLFNHTPILNELVNLKRLGVPSVIPLAALLARPTFIRVALSASVAISILCATAMPLFVDAHSLPLYQAFALNLGDRNAGTVSNPNDFAYICTFGLSIALYSLHSRRRCSAVTKALLVSAFVMSLYGIITSGSRSGFVALICGTALVAVNSRTGILGRLALIGLLASCLAAGYVFNPMFKDRLGTAGSQETSKSDVLSRWEAQQVAVVAAIHNPLGVGFASFPEATAEYAGSSSYFMVVEGSDSMYADFLLATGFLGFLSLLACLYQCWHIMNRYTRIDRVKYLQGGFLGALIFGAATISPASPFVASHFFIVVALAAVEQHSVHRQLSRNWNS